MAILLLALAACTGTVMAAQPNEITFIDGSGSHIDGRKWYKSDGWTNGDHQSCEWRASAISVHGGKMELRLSDNGGKVRPIGCAEIRTNERMGYGTYETRMRTAAGSGLNTAFFTFIGPPVGVPEHDEIDFEFLGKDPNSVSVTHFTNGKSTTGKVVALGYDASKDFHNYKFVWTKTKITWYADGKQIYESPQGTPIPRNETRIYFSLWSGSKVEDSWMGSFQYKEPVTAEVEWVKFTPEP